MASPRVVLPEPEFADDAKRLAFAHLDRNTVHGLDVTDRPPQQAALDREPDLEIVGAYHDRTARVERRRLALGLGRQQVARIGMRRRLEHVLDRAVLHDLALLHDADAVSDLAHDTEVMGNEQHGHAHPGLNLLQQFEDLRLHRDVERRRRLVGDQEVRLVGERHGDHYTLALPT